MSRKPTLSDTPHKPSRTFGKVTILLCVQCALIAAIGWASHTPLLAISIPIVGVSDDPTIWDGVYTEKQRDRGKKIYATSCLRCHKKELDGKGVTPSLAGKKFLKRWERKSVGNLFELIRKDMPPKVADRLTADENTDVLAYILSKNKAPVGKEDLANTFTKLQPIKMGR